MTMPQGIIFLTALALAASAVNAQPFEQRGPTGDNRAATTNPGTQKSSSGAGKQTNKEKTPMRRDAVTPDAAKPMPTVPADATAPTHSSGTPAENSVQPDSAK